MFASQPSTATNGLCPTCTTNCALFTSLVNSYSPNTHDTESDTDTDNESDTNDIGDKLHRRFVARAAALHPFPCRHCEEGVGRILEASTRKLAMRKERLKNYHGNGTSVVVASVAIAYSAACIAASFGVHLAASVAPVTVLQAHNSLVASTSTASALFYICILGSPLLLANPLAPFLNSTSILFHSYTPLLVQQEHSQQPSIAWTRDNSVIHLLRKPALPSRNSVWKWLGLGRSRRQKNNAPEKRGILRIRLHKWTYLTSQILLLLLRFSAIHILAHPFTDPQLYASYNLIFLTTTIAFLALLKSSLVPSIIASKKPITPTATPPATSPTRHSLPPLHPRRTSSELTSLTNHDTDLDDPSSHPSDPIDSLEFAFANTLVPSKPRKPSVARTVSSQSILEPTDSFELFYKQWARRIQFLKVGGVGCGVVSIVTYFVWDNNTPFDGLGGTGVMVYVHMCSRVLGACFGVMWRYEARRWFDEDLGEGEGRRGVGTALDFVYYLLCIVNILLAIQEVGVWELPKLVIRVSDVPVWAGRELLEVFEVDSSWLIGWGSVVGQLMVMIGSAPGVVRI
ncbi:hypothetical protein BCR33DRAFT_721859 [Rhizoclosmatium globosum]|uniref:Uncharacterized protein n=1 Tax=Rhizoclosmatium globosum TaxID=329046 RepID=A0A1Y2BPF5_9FUNG|nr:hypothetical protein BCR33DRAFT_721859 [Rhizoclosmatium globosum]|eukprot:ORY36631.1 hypothetical protein BCR33DRAFT_721859 [Rhizoclosmatium globosum]